MGGKGLGYGKIFVSLDGTERQGKVLERAIALASASGASLTIGYVVDAAAVEAAGGSIDEVAPAQEAAFRASIAERVAEAEADPQIPSVEVMVGVGRIRETLKDDMLDVVEPDLVVCGARGLSSIHYAKLGSISTFLARSADCDALVVK